MKLKNNHWKKNFILFLSSQTISLFGSALVQYAITWYITLETKSGIMMTISIICGILPTFFMAPFAGVWADRYNRKKLIVLSDAFIALSTLAMAVLFLAGYRHIWLMFVVSGLRAVGTAIQQPTVGALLPQLVEKDYLTKANASFGSIQSLVTLVSPILAGFVLTVASIELIFFIDVITAAIAIFILLTFIDIPTLAAAARNKALGYLSNMKEGLHYIRNHGLIRTLFIYTAAFFFLIAPLAFLTPLQVTLNYGGDVWRLTAIEIAFSLGMIAGGVLMATWGGFKNKLYSLVLSNAVISLCTLIFGFRIPFWFYLAVDLICGLSLPIFNVPFSVLMQLKTDESYLGRVLGVLTMISSLMMPLGMVVYGPLSEVVRIEWLMLATGTLLVALTVSMAGNKLLYENCKSVAEEKRVLN